MEKLRDRYYTTPWKKNSIYPISNTKNILVTEKLHFLENYPHTHLITKYHVVHILWHTAQLSRRTHFAPKAMHTLVSNTKSHIEWRGSITIRNLEKSLFFQ